MSPEGSASLAISKTLKSTFKAKIFILFNQIIKYVYCNVIATVSLNFEPIEKSPQPRSTTEGLGK